MTVTHAIKRVRFFILKLTTKTECNCSVLQFFVQMKSAARGPKSRRMRRYSDALQGQWTEINLQVKESLSRLLVDQSERRQSEGQRHSAVRDMPMHFD